MAVKGIIKVYANRIRNGKITIDDVPESIREEVREYLESEEI